MVRIQDGGCLQRRFFSTYLVVLKPGGYELDERLTDMVKNNSTLRYPHTISTKEMGYPNYDIVMDGKKSYIDLMTAQRDVVKKLWVFEAHENKLRQVCKFKLVDPNR